MFEMLITHGGENFNNIGEFLKHRRLQLNMTQMFVANECKVSQQSITSYESGKRIPSQKALLSLSEVLIVEFSKLMEMKALTELSGQISESDLGIDMNDYVIKIEPRIKDKDDSQSDDSKLKTENISLRNKVLELESALNKMKNEISSILNKY